MRFHPLDTPLGCFVLVRADDDTFFARWERGDDRDIWRSRGHRDDTLEPELVERLERYFRGEDVSFVSLRLPLPGNKDSFRRRCWDVCLRIPQGQTWTYGQLARAAGGDVTGSRAAGQAMRHNPLPVIVPCHRVLPASGGLGGFAGSLDPDGPELRMKRALLELESADATRTLWSNEAPIGPT